MNNANKKTLDNYLEERHMIYGPALLDRLPEGFEEKPYTLIRVKPLGRTLGAEIEGADLSKPIGNDLKEELHRAFLEWKVLFFRNQNLTSDQHKAFARLWGEIETHPFSPKKDPKEFVLLHRTQDTPAQHENIWHNDQTFQENPPFGAILRMVECPPVGGDTVFADMAAAYDNLPKEVKEKIDGLKAEHHFTFFGNRISSEELAIKQKEFPPVEHPVVRTHPETGRKTLFVNANFTTRIVGMEVNESEWLLRYLFAQATRPEYQVRFKWEPNSLAIWDNRAVQHCAVVDYYPHARRAERVSIVGDIPY